MYVLTCGRESEAPGGGKKPKKKQKSPCTNEVRISHVEGIWTPASKVDPFPDPAATSVALSEITKTAKKKNQRDVKKAAQFDI